MINVLIETTFNNQIQHAFSPMNQVLLRAKLQQLMPELTDTHVLNDLFMTAFVNRPPRTKLVLRNQPMIKAAINQNDWLLAVTNQASGKRVRFMII